MKTATLRNRILFTNLAAILGCVGMLGWLITHFYGGMVLWFYSYGIFILFFLILYVFSVVETIVSYLNYGRISVVKIAMHSAVIIVLIALNLLKVDILKPNLIMTAVHKGHTEVYRLNFRSNGTVENQVHGSYGYSETFHGSYHFEDSLVVFDEKPFNTNFIPDTLLIDKEHQVLFMRKNHKGHFIKRRVLDNYFSIQQLP